MKPFATARRALLVAATLSLHACGMPGAHSAGRGPWPTLDGQAPLVIAHRGASGDLPEETREADARAVELGADVIEMDLVSTRDGVLIARHDVNLAISTDVAMHPEFAARKKTLDVDGAPQTGWFCNDFTLAEIRTLGAIAPDPARPQQFNGLFKVLTFQEVIDFARAQSKATGRSVAIYPESKNPDYFRAHGLPIEGPIVATLAAAGWNHRTAPVFVQSFSADSLQRMRRLGLRTRVVQLVGGAERHAMLTPAGLARIAAYADGIGPSKRDVTATVVADAHRAGLVVHPFTFSRPPRGPAADGQNDPVNEYLAYYRLGVDGVFTDFSGVALAARAAFLKQIAP